MIRDEVVEELFLDYKASDTVSPFSKLGLSDRANFAKAVSGFGNSDGGVLIWGVDCRLVPDRGDVPIGIKPIGNAMALKTLLDGAVSGVTLPPHLGVESAAISTGASGEGVVITLIREALNVPLQAVGARSGYYIRAASNFLPAPHGVLAGMFGRTPRPLIKLKTRMTALQPSSPEMSFRPTVSLDLKICNEGRGLLHRPFITIDVDRAVNLVGSPLNNSDWTLRRRDRPPGYQFAVIAAQSLAPVPPGSEIVFPLSMMFCEGAPASISISVGAENTAGFSLFLSVPKDEIENAMDFFWHLAKNGEDVRTPFLRAHRVEKFEALLNKS